MQGNCKLGRTTNNHYAMVSKCINCDCKKVTMISKDKLQHADGLLGKLFVLPGGKVPVLGSLPLV